MYPESQFDEVVLFELPPAHADELCSRLKPTRLAWLHRNEDAELFVVVALRVELDDLARLLRDVQSWMADADVSCVVFLLDGRQYELRARAEALAA